MYKRNAQGWSKHLDFFLLELLSLQAAYIIAGLIRHGRFPYVEPIYRNLGIVITLADIVVLMLFNTLHNVIKRNYINELVSTVKHCVAVFLVAILYTFAIQLGKEYSRLVFFYMLGLHIAIGYGTRLLWKTFIRHYGTPGAKKETMLVVADMETAAETVKRLFSHEKEGYQPTGIVLTRDIDLFEVEGVPIVSSLENAADYVCREWTDAVYVDCRTDDRVLEFIRNCCEMAVPVHLHIPVTGTGKQFVERIGGVSVLTMTINYATPLQALLKRGLDILGGIVGSLITLFLILIIGPIIKIKSPGPVFFKQE